MLDSFAASPILNHMVKYQERALDRTLAALADPTRRAWLAQLGKQQGLSVSELARPFPVSLPAIMKHLDVLSDAGLITRAKSGRTVAGRLSPAPREQPLVWLRLARAAACLQREGCMPSQNLSQANLPNRSPSKSPASPSNVVSVRR